MLGASLLSVGVSNAAGTTIKACAKKSGGAMRLIDVKKKCKKSERTLTWGTKGSTGSKGAAGLRGAAGTNGLSTVYSKTGSDTAYGLSNTTLEGVVLALPSIPAGSYSVSLTSQIDQYTSINEDEAASSHSSFVDCTLTSANTWGGRNDGNMIYPKADGFTYSFLRTVFLEKSDDSAGHGVHLASTGSFSIASPTTINLLCKYSDDRDGTTSDGITFRFPSVTLTKVNQIITP